MILRRALDDAVRRGLIVSNPAKVAHAPKRRPLSSTTSRVWNAQQLAAFVTSTHDPTATTSRCGSPRTPACDAARSSGSAGATSTSTWRSCASPDRSCQSATSSTRHAANPAPPGDRSTSTRRTIEVLQRPGDSTRAPKTPSSTPTIPTGTCSADPTAPHPPTAALGRVPEARAADPACRRFDSTIYATPTPPCCLKAGVPIKVVSERLGHSTPGFTMATYQHVIPGMQHEAAHTFADSSTACAESTDFYPVEVPVEGRQTRTRPWSGKVP